MRATDMKSSFPVVGIGASAGGLRALEGFFAAMPANPGMAFVIITHLAPDRKSLLIEILARHTSVARRGRRRWPKGRGRQGLCHAAQRDPDDCRRAVAAGGDPHERHERAPIDIFFSSLARSCGEYAVGVVLSGSGADGVLGVKAIKETWRSDHGADPDGSGPGFAGHARQRHRHRPGRFRHAGRGDGGKTGRKRQSP